MTRTKALRLVCSNADVVGRRKLELDKFLGQYGIEICLLKETHLRSREIFRMANYVCHRTDRLIEGDGTAILIRRVVDHYTVHIQGLKHPNTAAIQAMLVTKTVKILAVYISRPPILYFLRICMPDLAAVLPFSWWMN